MTLVLGVNLVLSVTQDIVESTKSTCATAASFCLLVGGESETKDVGGIVEQVDRLIDIGDGVGFIVCVQFVKYYIESIG